jgi:hypothetical protein
MIGRPVTAAAALLLGVLLGPLAPEQAGATTASASTPSPASSQGQAIYRKGLLASGAALVGKRQADGLQVRGAQAACVNCHQRSGLGTTEGRSRIPPVTGRYLFRPRATNDDRSDLPYVEGMRADRDPYSERTLARAIREGVDSEGKALSYLMPRFSLGDADMGALISYLKSMDPARLPGVTDTVLHFATIITPDADPVARDGMLKVIEQYFKDKNDKAFLIGPSARMHPSGKTMYSKSMFMVPRRWQLHVWTLEGDASTWRAQLEKHMADEPVLAVVSGLGGSNWEPVHRFCEREAVPCLFPNVDVPVDDKDAFYSLYFSKGVLLEADLIARRFASAGGSASRVRNVVQVYRAGDVGAVAASALQAQLKSHGVRVTGRAIPAGAGPQAAADALREAGNPDALVLWLRPSDLEQLGSSPPAGVAVFLSALMSGQERAPLPAAWRSQSEMAYPFDLPDKRRVRLDYPLGWFAVRHIPVVAERVQSDTFLACGLLSETINHLTDAFVRPYLIERLQTMVEHRIITGYYPHLTLASNQHFASKGGYIVRFADSGGTRLIADSDWLVP